MYHKYPNILFSTASHHFSFNCRYNNGHYTYYTRLNTKKQSSNTTRRNNYTRNCKELSLSPCMGHKRARLRLSSFVILSKLLYNANHRAIIRTKCKMPATRKRQIFADLRYLTCPSCTILYYTYIGIYKKILTAIDCKHRTIRLKAAPLTSFSRSIRAPL